jgi:hypothetical protein
MSSLCDTFSSTGGCFLVGSASYNLIIKKVTLEQNHSTERNNTVKLNSLFYVIWWIWNKKFYHHYDLRETRKVIIPTREDGNTRKFPHTSSEFICSSSQHITYRHVRFGGLQTLITFSCAPLFPSPPRRHLSSTWMLWLMFSRNHVACPQTSFPFVDNRQRQWLDMDAQTH